MNYETVFIIKVFSVSFVVTFAFGLVSRLVYRFFSEENIFRYIVAFFVSLVILTISVAYVSGLKMTESTETSKTFLIVSFVLATMAGLALSWLIFCRIWRLRLHGERFPKVRLSRDKTPLEEEEKVRIKLKN